MSVNPAPPVPSEPLANKAVVSALGTLVLVLHRWAVSGEFQLSDEGLITLAGAITTVGVYAVSNFRRLLGFAGERGYSLVEVLLAVFLILVIVYVLFAIVPADG